MSIIFNNPNAINPDAEVKVKIAVHGGVFHADDVLAVAIASYLYGQVIIDRVFTVNDESAYDYIIDVGKQYDGVKWFDHHQEIEPLDEEGVLPCGVSLFAKAVLQERLYNSLYERILRPICVQDNGQSDLTVKYPNMTFGWIRYMNPSWDSDESPDTAFEKTVLTALPILEAIISKINSEEAAVQLVENAPTLEGGAIVILPKYAPWQNVVVNREEAKFVVFPSNRGGFMLNAVPPTLEDMFSQRVPIRWENIIPEGCSFVHKACFCAAFDTEEHAINAAKSLL